MKTYTLILVLFSVYINAQNTYNSYGADNNNLISHNKKSSSKVDLSSFTGSIYINDDFTKGQVIDKLSQKSLDIFLRYDAYSDTFQANSSNQKVKPENTYIKKATEIEISYAGGLYKYINFKGEKGNSKQGYLQELLNTEETIIYYRQEKQLKQPEKAATSYESDKKGSINNKKYFVIKFKNGVKAEKISKKNIATFFSADLKEKVTQITKEEKLKYKNPEDIKTLARLLK